MRQVNVLDEGHRRCVVKAWERKVTCVDIIIQLHSVISQFFIIVMPFAQFYMFTSSRIILDSSRFICNMSHFPHISTASTR